MQRGALIGSIEVTIWPSNPHPTAYQPLALTQIRIHPTLNLDELEWSKNELLIMAGSKLRLVFLPNAFETKSGDGYQARTELSCALGQVWEAAPAVPPQKEYGEHRR